MAAAAMATTCVLSSSCIAPRRHSSFLRGAAAAGKPVRRVSSFRQSQSSNRPLVTVAKDVSAQERAGIAAGGFFLPIVLWSEWQLRITGEGLPPGPFGILGAAEGIGYLVVVGLVAWSIYTKAQTGTGLPPGPYGLLGAIEGLAYLALGAGIVVFGLQILEKGGMPGMFG
eukprot:jgi/Chlat1/1539/Chrsp122S01811